MWNKLCCLAKEVNLSILLRCGQSFRWTELPVKRSILYNKVNEQGCEVVWLGVLGDKLWILKQCDDYVHFQTIDNSLNSSESKELDLGVLKDYLQLNVNLSSLYTRWAEIDQNFNKLQCDFSGIRMLRQDPVENLFTFICSQNNNIPRITQLVNKLCLEYGKFICNFEGIKFCSFPNLDSLASDGVEEDLRKQGFGYRAKFIAASAEKIQEYGGEKWLSGLREQPYVEAHKALCSLPGVGAKVADCVCLMSLDKPSAIPVDTHMWQIAVRDYLPHLGKNKTLTDKMYKEIGDFFRDMHGKYAGWAQSVLFSADLKIFNSLKKENKADQVKCKNINASKRESAQVKEQPPKEESRKRKKSTNIKSDKLPHASPVKRRKPNIKPKK